MRYLGENFIAKIKAWIIGREVWTSDTGEGSVITVACKESNGADTKKGALGSYSHAEGYRTTASGNSSHAECDNTTARGSSSHAEGYYTTARGSSSHAEGFNTTASGSESHAEGSYTTASGNNSHAEGDHTTASGNSSHAEGAYNVKDTHAIHSVGIGNNVVSKNAEYIYIGRSAYGGINVSDPKHGYKYLIGVGGYDGVSTDNSKYKSVQEVIAELTEKTAEIGKSYFEVRFAGEGTITINGESTSLEKRQLFRYEGTPTSLKIEGSHLAWLDVSNLDTSKITSMNGLFSKCDSSAYGSTLNVSGWDVSNVTNMTYMLNGYRGQIEGLGRWNTSKVTICANTFYNCCFATHLEVGTWDVSNVTNMSSMFLRCKSLLSLDVSGWDVSNVTNMFDLFAGCEVLPSLDVSSWNVSKLVQADYMFTGCYKLSTVDFSGWDTSRLESFAGFSQGVGFKTIVFGENFGKMTDKFTSLDISQISTWKDDSVKSLLNLYDRKANGMGVVTIKLHANTKAVLGEDGIAQLTAKGYTIA